MQAISRAIRMLWGALFLQPDAYQEMREDDNPFVEGLFVLVILGVVIGVVAFLGITLEWASTPNLARIQEVVLDNLRQMPWYEQMTQAGGAQAEQMFRQIYDMNWSFVRSLSPSPVSGLSRLLLAPLGLIVGWLIFGLIAHAIARLLGGTANLSQTLGTTALASAPQILTAIAALPFVAVAGVGTWTLLCRYMALRTAHDLTWPRAVWAALLPPLILGLVVAILAILAGVIFGATIASLFAGGS